MYGLFCPTGECARRPERCVRLACDPIVASPAKGDTLSHDQIGRLQ